jgi:excinuclease ABC subunit A
MEKYMANQPCPSCKGYRLKKESLAVLINGLHIGKITEMSVSNALQFFRELELSEKDMKIANLILREIEERLGFLNNVGLDYLTLSRAAGTLSGGEAQPIRLATQIGSRLTGVLYILDEPSIGLHQRDNDRLIDTLKNMRDIGNTLIVVEHDEDTMLAADYLIDIGPGAGVHGGEVISAGTPEEVMNDDQSLTGQYLSGKKFIPLPAERRKPDNRFIEVKGAKENNLKNVSVKFPLGVFTAVTVSGSGKSTLVNEILHKTLAQKLHRAKAKPGEYKEIKGIEHLDKGDRHRPVSDSAGRRGQTRPHIPACSMTSVTCLPRRMKRKSEDTKKGASALTSKAGAVKPAKATELLKSKCTSCPMYTFLVRFATERDTTVKRFRSHTKVKTFLTWLEMTVENAVNFLRTSRKSSASCRPSMMSGLAILRSDSRLQRFPGEKRSGSNWHLNFIAVQREDHSISWTSRRQDWMSMIIAGF